MLSMAWGLVLLFGMLLELLYAVHASTATQQEIVQSYFDTFLYGD